MKSRSQISAGKTISAAKQHSRRQFLKGAVVVGSAAVLSPWIVEDAFSSSGNLNLMIWPDYIPVSLKDGFRKATGITIKQTSVASNEEMLKKLSVSKGAGYDLICPTNDQGEHWKNTDLLSDFDMNRIDTEAVLPSMLKFSENFSWDGKSRHIPFLWGAEALAYRVDKFTTEYDKLSFGDLWQPEMRSKIMGRPQSMLAGIGRYLEGAGKIQSFAEGYENEEKMRNVWDQITQFAIDHKSWVRRYWNDAEDQINGFMRDRVILGQVWDGPSQRMFKEGKPVRFLAPKEGAFTWMDGLSIPVGARNIDAIYEFIKYTNLPENAGLVANETGYNSVAVGAIDHLTSENKKAFISAYPEDALDRLWAWPATPSWYANLRDGYLDKFIKA